MRSGFFARCGLLLGDVIVSHGYGGLSQVVPAPSPEVVDGPTLVGRRAPLAATENRGAPSALVAQSGDKKSGEEVSLSPRVMARQRPAATAWVRLVNRKQRDPSDEE